jgi:hypothetical protein
VHNIEEANMKKILLSLTGIIVLLGCDGGQQSESLDSDQIRQVSSICNEFEDPDMKRQCLIDAFGSAAVTGRSSN